MIDLTDRRLVIAHNPLSSRAGLVEQNVFQRLDQAGYSYHKIEVQRASLQKNVESLKAQIKPGDVILSAGGDGSAHALTNAVIAADQPGVSLGFLAYGNFNDMAHSLNKKPARRDPLQLLQRSTEQVYYPLSLYNNHQLERRALLYVTIGWTAKAAADFDDMSARKRVVRNGSASLIGSLWRAFKFYLRTRASSDLADFTIDQQTYSRRTDILFANGTSVARLFKTGQSYGRSQQFLLRTLRVRWLVSNLGFLLLGLVKQINGQARSDVLVQFAQASKLPIQCDGEVFELETDKLAVKKGDIAITVMSSK